MRRVWSGLVQRQKGLAVDGRVFGKSRRKFVGGNGAALEPALLEDGHRQACDGKNAAVHDLSFQGIQLLVLPVGELDKRNALGDFNDVEKRVGAESLEVEQAGGRRRTDMP